MGELLPFSSFTGIFTRISLILYNLRPVDCSKWVKQKTALLHLLIPYTLLIMSGFIRCV